MTPTLETFAMLHFTYRGNPSARPVRLIGIDPVGRSEVGGFVEFLTSPQKQRNPATAFQMDAEAQRRFDHNNPAEFREPKLVAPPLFDPKAQIPSEIPTPNLPPVFVPRDGKPAPEGVPDSKPFAPTGAVIGYAIGHYRVPAENPGDPVTEVTTLLPGEEILIITVSGAKLGAAPGRFVVTDYIKTEMAEYDGNYIYVPLEHLQRMRAMENKVTSIQIKLHDFDDAKAVVARLSKLLYGEELVVNTWEQKQGPLLAAISVEKGILNVLLFMIVAVAGFGILAIFSMIVAEKTRDIGILKSLGASSGGVMKIFLGYGMLLGVVGATLGSILGLMMARNINAIEHFLGKLVGMELFPRDIYYFDEIPVDVQVFSVVLVNIGAVAIAVLFSILPAMRAAMLHPVRALRWE
jgi:lipoprotein-releasing system permease protein